mgnify:CR=1 FL=1
MDGLLDLEELLFSVTHEHLDFGEGNGVLLEIRAAHLVASTHWIGEAQP